VKRILYFLLTLLFIANFSFGINASVDLSDKAYIKIVSDKNISAKIKSMNYSEIYSYYRDNKYIWYLHLDWDKKKFIYNFSSICRDNNFNYTISCDRYLSIKNQSFKNGILNIYTQPNYKIIGLGLSLLILFPILGCFILSMYFKGLFKEKPKSLRERINRTKKIGIVYGIYALIFLTLFIISLPLCNLPDLIVYLTNIPELTAIILIIVWLILIIFMPLILNMKNLARQNNKKISKKDYLKTISALTLPWILGFFAIIFLSDKILEFFGNYLVNIPTPLSVAFWLIIGFISFYPAWKLVKKFILKPKYVENPEIVEIVNELSKKLNTKPFKEIKIVENDVIANAMVSGFLNEKLTITTKLIKILSKEELKSIIAHEISHKKKRHIKIGFIGWFIIGIVVFSGLSYTFKFFGKLFGDSSFIWTGLLLFAYLLDTILDRKLSKNLEKEADVIASKITNPKVYIKALTKLHYANCMPESGVFSLFSTHPSLKDRIKYIQKEFNIPEEDIKKIMNEAYKEIEELQKKGE